MTKRVLIIGGYGNFGSYIAKTLAKDADIQLLIGGRNLEKAQKFIGTLGAIVKPEVVALDIHEDLDEVFAMAKPDIVIHTTGPFQDQGYLVVKACLRHGCHYIDLADARNYVVGIRDYDLEAKEKNLLVVSGASSVPCLTAAVIDHYRTCFKTMDKVEYGITAAQHTNRGFATASAVLSYVGEPFGTLIRGEETGVYGWQDMHAHKYPELGLRLFGNCDIPDLELFPARYPELKTIRFSAGHEIALLHIGLWLLSWPVRIGFIPSLDHIASYLFKMSRFFDFLGSGRSGFHMLMSGIGKDGKPKAEAFYMIAKSGHGPNIPCMPAILLTRGLVRGTITTIGAQPCLDLIDLDTYCGALKGLDIKILRDVPLPPPKPEIQQVKKIPKANVVAEAYSYRDDLNVPKFPEDKPLFVFDGACVLCSTGAAWLMKGKHAEKFYFTSAQSPLGQALYKHYKVPMDDTYLLINQGVKYTKSDGYLHMLPIMGGAWIYLQALKEIPCQLRDRVYDCIAKNRYKWFGKTEYCARIPDGLKGNLLE